MMILEAKSNHFLGIEVDMGCLPGETAVFQQQLAHSLNIWRDGGFKLVWLQIPITQANLIPTAVDAGFRFHHSDENYLMLVYQIQPDAFIPPYATHYIGAGGVVINDKNELLVIWERSHSRRYYKLPGGAIHAGEHLADGVMREVFEETGIHTKFESLVFFRHWHGYRYGKSDIYFICRLTPLTSDINMQLEEVQECFWMPVDEYLTHENVGLFNRRIVEMAINGQGLVPGWFDGYEPDPMSRELFLPGAKAE